MTAEYIEPMNFEKIFVEYFLGTKELFAFAFIIIFSFACAKYQMQNKVFLVLLAISSLMFSAWLSEPIYFLVLFIIGFLVGKSVSRMTS